jgi:hypothetical protein
VVGALTCGRKINDVSARAPIMDRHGLRARNNQHSELRMQMYLLIKEAKVISLHIKILKFQDIGMDFYDPCILD